MPSNSYSNYHLLKELVLPLSIMVRLHYAKYTRIHYGMYVYPLRCMFSLHIKGKCKDNTVHWYHCIANLYVMLTFICSIYWMVTSPRIVFYIQVTSTWRYVRRVTIFYAANKSTASTIRN